MCKMQVALNEFRILFETRRPPTAHKWFTTIVVVSGHAGHFHSGCDINKQHIDIKASRVSTDTNTHREMYHTNTKKMLRHNSPKHEL